jgi:hypothetical protein
VVNTIFEPEQRARQNDKNHNKRKEQVKGKE